MQRGFFITFEGNEGCGKSTQIERLAARLRSLNVPVLVTREPGGTPIGEEIRHLLQFSDTGRAMMPETELLLFAASRAQLVREVIRPALDSGATVLADRFHDSTTVYQGVARRIDPECVRLINEFAIDGCVPDVTLLFDLDLETARRRLLRRARPVGVTDRMEQQRPEFYAAVRTGYLELARREPVRIHVIDAARSRDDIAEAVWTVVREKCHGLGH